MNIRWTVLIVVVASPVLADTPLLTLAQRSQRRTEAFSTRSRAALFQFGTALGTQTVNNDGSLGTDLHGVFAKSLSHADGGLPVKTAIEGMLEALRTGTPSLFDAISMGTSPVQRRLVDPYAAFAFNLDGADGWIHIMPPPPALDSAEAAGEMVELYWHALLRDVSFNDYDTDSDATAAIADLNGVSVFTGPKINGLVTAQTLFRGQTAGDIVGPLISQFLYLPIPYGPGPNFDGSGALSTDYQTQVVPTTSTDNDFMTTFNEWLFIQRGNNPSRTITYSNTRTFIRNARDLGDYVHQDYPQQPYVNAALILLGFGGAALDQNNPFIGNPTQEPFPTYNVPDFIYMISVAAEVALRTAWYQKWLVHRRVRPEFMSFLIHQQKTGMQCFSCHQDVITSTGLARTFTDFSSYLLPQAYPEGSPTHPAYPAGHAVVAGACATVLKAFFNENYVISSPVQPNAGNTAIEAYTGTSLTVGGELNKLAANISLGRDMAGVHCRSDGVQGLLLGEKVALALLEDEAFTRKIAFTGFSITKFDGSTVVIGAKQSPVRGEEVTA